MSASPEFYKPAPAFSPCRSPLLPRRDAAAGAGVGAGAGAGVPVPGGADQEGAWEEQCCRTPTGAGVELKQAGAGTCPPAPRKPRAPAAPCRKRLFEVEVLSLRLDELERLFWRPHAHAHAHTPPPPPERKMKRRRVAPPLSSPAGPSKS